MEPACRPSVKNWVVLLREQMKEIRRLNNFYGWGLPESAFMVDIPDSIPCADNEMPLISIYLPDKDGITGEQRTFNCLWDAIRPPSRYYKWRQEWLFSNPSNLRLTPGNEHQPGIDIVAFNPNITNQSSNLLDLSLNNLRSGAYKAHSEVLMAIITFREWVRKWDGIKIPFPKLGGYQYREKRETKWEKSIYFYHWPEDNKFCLFSLPSEGVGDHWSEPIARKCLNVCSM